MIQIDYQFLSDIALDNLLTEIVSRAGTDYGEVEIPLETKKQQLKHRLQTGKAEIIYDSTMDFFDIISREKIA